MFIGFACTADAEIPAAFLPAPTEAMRRVLDKPVNGDFRAMSVRDVFAALFVQIHANLVFGTKKPIPTFTGKFDNVPFRTALFRVTHATGYEAEWTTRSDGRALISIHD